MTSRPNTEERVCSTCGGTFTVQVPAPGRPRQYCTTRCRNRAGEKRRRDKLREIGVLAERDPADPSRTLQPCGWCGVHSPGADYCSLACDVLHTKLKRLRYQLQGVRRTTPVPGLREKFDQVDRMAETRRQLRQASRARYQGAAKAQLDEEEAKRAAEEEREHQLEAARRRVRQQMLERERRVARRRAKKGN